MWKAIDSSDDASCEEARISQILAASGPRVTHNDMSGCQTLQHSSVGFAEHPGIVIHLLPRDTEYAADEVGWELPARTESGFATCTVVCATHEYRDHLFEGDRAVIPLLRGQALNTLPRLVQFVSVRLNPAVRRLATVVALQRHQVAPLIPVDPQHGVDAPEEALGICRSKEPVRAELVVQQLGRSGEQVQGRLREGRLRDAFKVC